MQLLWVVFEEIAGFLVYKRSYDRLGGRVEASAWTVINDFPRAVKYRGQMCKME